MFLKQNRLHYISDGSLFTNVKEHSDDHVSSELQHNQTLVTHPPTNAGINKCRAFFLVGEWASLIILSDLFNLHVSNKIKVNKDLASA